MIIKQKDLSKVVGKDMRNVYNDFKHAAIGTREFKYGNKEFSLEVCMASSLKRLTGYNFNTNLIFLESFRLMFLKLSKHYNSLEDKSFLFEPLSKPDIEERFNVTYRDLIKDGYILTKDLININIKVDEPIERLYPYTILYRMSCDVENLDNKYIHLYNTLVDEYSKYKLLKEYVVFNKKDNTRYLLGREFKEDIGFKSVCNKYSRDRIIDLFNCIRDIDERIEFILKEIFMLDNGIFVGYKESKTSELLDVTTMIFEKE